MTVTEKTVKIRQAIYRGAKTEMIERELSVTASRVNREIGKMLQEGITHQTPDLTTSQAAFLLGLSPDGKRVGVFIRGGRLASRRLGSILVIARKDFLEFASKPRIAGNPLMLLKKKKNTKKDRQEA